MGTILVSENIAGPAMDALKKEFEVEFLPDIWKSPDALREKIPDFRALIVRNQTKVTKELIRAASALRVIGRAGAGLDNIDVEAATEAGVVVAYTPEQNSISVAELTLGMMLALARKIVGADRDTKEGGWNRLRFTGIELYGKTLGLVGLGRIGYRTATRAKAFGMSVIAHDEYANPDGIAVSELRAPLLSLEALFASADFVSCHVPLTPRTRNFFDYAKFCAMKPTAFFINTSRGEVVEESGLIRALEEGKIAGAALDVRQKEPPGNDALSRMENVILTPHIAAFTHEGQDRVSASVCADVAAVVSGNPAKNYANFPMPRKV
jgi:D-3-phosphoglycerate dehydrogenase / 2-oxoglutarate reductase